MTRYAPRVQPPPVPPPAPAATRPTNALAIVALIAGILGLMFFPAAIGAVVCGMISRNQISVSGEEGRGLAQAGLVMGWISIAYHVLIIVAVIGMMLLGFGAAFLAAGH